MYGFTAKKLGGIFTHIVGYTSEELKAMSDHSHCYSNNEFTKWLSFIHLVETDYDSFMETFDITLVETKKELRFLEKLTR